MNSLKQPMAAKAPAVPFALRLWQGLGSSKGRRRADQRGISTLEVLVASSLSVLILMVLVTATVQLYRGNIDQRTAIAGVDETMHATGMMVRDIQMAEELEVLNEGGALEIAYTRESGTVTVTYALSGTRLERSVAGGDTWMLAQGVTELSFARNGPLVSVTVTVRPEDGPGRERATTLTVHGRAL